MSVVNPWMSESPAPATSHTLFGVPGFVFSAGIGLSWGKVPMVGGRPPVEDAPLKGRQSCVRHVALPPGPHAAAAWSAVTTTLAPSGPPDSAMSGLDPPGLPARQ